MSWHRQRIAVVFFGLVAACCVNTTLAAVMSVNVAGSQATNALASTDVVGVVAVDDWNNLTAVGVDATGLTVTDLKDDSGATTTADITTKNFHNAAFDGNGAGIYNFGGYSSEAEDAKMLNLAAFARSGTSTDVVVVAQIPYSLYDVYVYSNQGSGTGRPSNFAIGSTTIGLTTITGYSPVPPYDEATGVSPGGNYVRFSNLSGTSFTLAVAGFGAENQTAIAGLQIVQVPEPSGLGLILLGTATCVLARRRRAG